MAQTPLYEQIYAVVRLIPAGQVTTYGQIASVIGGKCRARTVGYAMAALPFDTDVPWHRVINRQGKVSPRIGGTGSAMQREMLEAEGVQFDDRYRTNLSQFGWGGPDWAWLEERGFNLMPRLDD